MATDLCKGFIEEWFKDFHKVGRVTLQELLVSFRGYHKDNIESLEVNRKAISKYLREIGFEDVRNSSGMVFILTER